MDIKNNYLPSSLSKRILVAFSLFILLSSSSYAKKLTEYIITEVPPCKGKIAASSTVNLIEYHTVSTNKGRYLLACDEAGALRISEEDLLFIGLDLAKELKIEYATRGGIDEYLDIY